MKKQQMSDEEIAVSWLNAARGTPAYRRALEVYERLTCLDSEYLKWQDAIMKDAAYDFKAKGKKLGRQHAELNKLLSRYRTIPQIQYWLASAAWTCFTASCRTRGDFRLPYGDGLFIQEGTVISIFLKLTESGNLGHVRLCPWCKKRWRVSFRTIDRFCSGECRARFYFSTPEGKRLHNEAQKRFLKSPGYRRRKMQRKRDENAQEILRNLGREKTRKSQKGEN